MKKILCMMVAVSFLFIGGLAFGVQPNPNPSENYFQKFEQFIPQAGEYVQENEGVLQVYEDYIIRLGQYYTCEGDYYQYYKNYLLQTGDLIGDDGQVYKDYLPQTGEYYEMVD